MYALRFAFLVGLALAQSTHAQAQAQAAEPTEERSPGGAVVLAPVSSLSGAKSKKLETIERAIEAGLALVPDFSVISARAASLSTRRGKRPQLRTCEGDVSCLAELGTLVKAQYAVYAEVGGLGDAQVIYLKLVDAASARELRSTTLQLTGDADQEQASRAAATRLLAPHQYVGTLEVKCPVDGAIVYLDGHKVASTPGASFPVYVGSHALRVTHPEHGDYVHWVDIEFGTVTSVVANLPSLPALNRKLSARGPLASQSAVGSTVPGRESPWYYRWYSITGGVVAVAITSAIIIGATSGGIDADGVRDL